MSEMRKRTKVLIGLATVSAGLVVGAGVASASSTDRSMNPIAPATTVAAAATAVPTVTVTPTATASVSASSQTPVGMLYIDAVDVQKFEKTITVAKGTKFAVGVYDNSGSTGYFWSVDIGADGRSVVSGLGSQRDAAYCKPSMPGCGGKVYYFFQANGAGSTTIDLVRARPWDKSAVANTVHLVVQVK